jgi:hypothetical protein
MAQFPTFQFPNRPQPLPAGAQIDFSRLSDIADNYWKTKDEAAQRQVAQEERAYALGERERASQGRQAVADAFKNGQPDFYKLAEILAPFDPAQATEYIKLAEQEADRQAQRSIQRDQLVPPDAREWQYYNSLPQEAQARYRTFKQQAGSSSFGRSGTIVQGNDGKFYSVQFGSDGSRKVEPLEIGNSGGGSMPVPAVQLAPSRGVDVVGNQMFDKATGTPVRNVGGNIAEAERQKVVGRETGEGQIGLPKAGNALREYEVKNQSVLGSIDTALKQGNAWTTGFIGNIGRNIAGTPAHDLEKTLVAIQANLGFETLQQMRDNSPTGGALGNVTERELEFLQSAWGSLAQSQSPGQFRENLIKLKQVKQRFAALKRQAYEADVKRFGAANVPNPDAGGSALQGRAGAFLDNTSDPLGIR